MLSEMTSYLKDANTPGVALDASTLLAMYANDGYTWEDGENLGMTGSSKQLKNKTVGGESFLFIKSKFFLFRFSTYFVILFILSIKLINGIWYGLFLIS